MAKIKRIYFTATFALILLLPASFAQANRNSEEETTLLRDSIAGIVSEYPAEIGVAVIIGNRDTVTLNNRSLYPMMSVFKLHQALALCHDLDKKGISLDTLIRIRRDELDPDTWSPMLREHTEPGFSLPVSGLLRYTLIQSDNNASNIMFERLTDTGSTDSFIARLIPRASFRICCTEAEMKADHKKAYANFTSPLGAAMLINRLFTDSIVSADKQRFITETLTECLTGTDRIAAPLLDRKGVVIAHKTGSGYRDNGILVAHNDVAYIRLPDNTSYSLAVFVKDFKGSEQEASAAIARISAAVYSVLTRQNGVRVIPE